MSKKDLSLKPQHFGNPNAWYYEDPKGIELVCDGLENPIILIPWKKIKASLKRLEK